MLQGLKVILQSWTHGNKLNKAVKQDSIMLLSSILYLYLGFVFDLLVFHMPAPIFSLIV